MPDEPDTQRRAPFYEHSWFKGGAALVGLVGAVWALTGAPKLWDVAEDLSATRFPLNNTAIVLDGSAGMEKRFGGERTKLDAAVDAVGDYVAPFSHEGLALLRSGGGCEDEGEKLVDFGEDHQDEVREAAAEVDPEGRSNLGNAVLTALDQFVDERFDGTDGMKRVVVFTGGGDQCIGDQAAARIRRELARTGIETVFNLVALKVPKAERGQLGDFTKALGERAVVEFVENEDELDDSVERAQEEALTAAEAPPAPPSGEELSTVPDEGAEAEPDAEAEGEAEVDDPEGSSTTTTEKEETGSAGEGESTVELEGEASVEGAAEAESETAAPPAEAARPPPSP
jgi:hypothetical protein